MTDTPFSLSDEEGDVLSESLNEARDILEDALELTANAAYVIGSVRELLPINEDEEIEFDEDDLISSEDESLRAIGQALKSILDALELLPPGEDDDEDDDEEE